MLTIKKRNTTSRTRFVVSIITFAFITSVLVVGSVGSVLQVTNARSDQGQYYSNQGRNNRNESNQSNRSNQNSNSNERQTTSSTNSSQRQSPTPTQTRRQQTPTPSRTTTTPTPPPTPQITRAPAIVSEPPQPVDTASEVAAMTAAQATQSGQSVAYTSQRISDDTRNRLMILAGIAVVTGGLLYTMSYIGAFSASRRPIPVRYIVPVREVITS